MLPFLLFAFGFLVCVCMYIADHKRALERAEARYKSDTDERRHTIVIGLFVCMLLTSLLTGS